MSDGRAPCEVAAVVLAAGASTRMGAPKALLEWGGRTFLRRVIDLAAAAGCAPIVAVAGAIRLPRAELGAAIEVVNETWSEGQLSSLQVGLRAIAGAPAALVLTVDRPHVRPSTIAALLAGHAADPTAIWQPAHGGRRGHPILYPGDLLPAIVTLPAALGPRSWLGSPAIAARRREVAVDDPAVLDNVDTPADLARLRREESHVSGLG